MSDTASPRPDQPLSKAPLLRRRLFIVWLVVLAGAAASLLNDSTPEMLAIELVIFTFAMLYGFGMWPVAPTVVSIVSFGVFAGAVMVPRARDGDLPSSELVEVVAPLVLAAVVMFHVRRRDDAVRRSKALAEAERRRALVRERLSRMTSHELRTPLTIASGYVDLLLAQEHDEGPREDLLVVRDELDQLARVTDRLVRAVGLDLGGLEGTSDVCALLEDTCRRWSGVVERDFVVDSRVHSLPVNDERLRAALDTLVENSVRYTRDGDRICLFSVRVGGRAEVGVADAGSGLSDELIARITREAEAPALTMDDDDDEAAAASHRLRDIYARTGFGMRLVEAIARSAGGHVVASRSELGGARVALAIPFRADGAHRAAPAGPGEAHTHHLSPLSPRPEPV